MELARTHAARKLHRFIWQRFWDGERLLGPDQGVRFNRRIGRYVKSALPFLSGSETAYYLQAQGYWVLCNWRLYDLTGDPELAEVATRCADSILQSQHPAGYWDYPHSGWSGRIATVEGAWAALGLLATYDRTRQAALLDGALRAYRYMVDHTGFQAHTTGYGINYFDGKEGALVPNNSTLALALFGRLARLAEDTRYLEHCPGMIAFLAASQTNAGELPYAVKTSGMAMPHWQCYQYNAFELQDLAMYHDATDDENVLPIISRVASYLATAVREDGSTRYDCSNASNQIIYHTASIAAALKIARRKGLCDYSAEEDRAYAWVIARQEAGGGYPFSVREHHVLRDRRYYPRYLSMILHHLLLGAVEDEGVDIAGSGSNAGETS